MMSDTSALSDLLTQEEIDALLNVNDTLPKADLSKLLKTGTQEKKFPVLEKSIDAFGRLLIPSIQKITQAEDISVSLQSFICGQLGAYLDTLSAPCILGTYRVQEWRQSCLVCLDTGLGYSLIDMSLGGRRGTAALQMTNRAYTRIEQNIIRSFLSRLQKDFKNAFDENFIFENLDTNPKTALIASPACDVIIARLMIGINKRKGTLDIVVPAHLVSQISQKENWQEDNARYGEQIAQALYRVPLTLKAVLDKKQIPFREVLKWKKGDLLNLSYFDEKPLEMMCENQTLLKGALKVHKKSLLVEIEKNAQDL